MQDFLEIFTAIVVILILFSCTRQLRLRKKNRGHNSGNVMLHPKNSFPLKENNKRIRKQDWGILTLAIGIVAQSSENIIEKIVKNVWISLPTSFEAGFHIVVWLAFLDHL